MTQSGETRYWLLPDHPLYRVPQNVLEVAREVMRSAVTWKDVDPEQAEPLADAVVAALAEAGFLYVDNGGPCSNYTAAAWSPTSPAPEDDRCVNCGLDRATHNGGSDG